MKVVAANPIPYDAKLTINPGDAGEAVSFLVLAEEVYFRVVWYGRPRVQTVHHSNVSIP